MNHGATVALVSLMVVALAACRRPGHRGRRLVASSTSPGAEVEADVRPRLEPEWLHELMETLPLAVDGSTAWTAIRGTAAVATMLAWGLAGLTGAVLTIAALVAVPAGARRVTAARRRSRWEAQLPVALERLATGVRSGSTLRQAFADTAHATPAPLGRDLRAIAAEVAHGAALPDALARWGNLPTAGPTARLAAGALSLAATSGGQVARSVDRVAATLCERREVHAEVRALATQATASALVLGVAPVAFTALVASVEPAVLSFLFTSVAGLVCLTAGVALDVVGAMWMARILRSVR